VVAAAGTTGKVVEAEEARATPVRHQRGDFARHSVAACSTMDTRKPQLDQRRPSDGGRCRCRIQDLGEECCRIERDDNSDQTPPGGNGFRKTTEGGPRPTQRRFVDSGHFLR
jgi:hypothetical protein